MKTTIWLVTLFGILPGFYLSTLNLITHIRSYGFFMNEAGPAFVWITFKPKLNFWPFKYQELTLTHNFLPAIITIIGIVLIVAGLFSLIPKQPTIVYKNGMAKIPKYVSKLMNSDAPFSSIGIFSVDGKKGFGIDKKEGKIEISLSSIISPPDGIEPSIRKLYKEMDIALSKENTFNDGACIYLHYSLPPDPQAIENISIRTLVSIYGVEKKDPLKFTFNEYR